MKTLLLHTSMNQKSHQKQCQQFKIFVEIMHGWGDISFFRDSPISVTLLVTIRFKKKEILEKKEKKKKKVMSIGYEMSASASAS